jgi:hypothetical protein
MVRALRGPEAIEHGLISGAAAGTADSGRESAGRRCLWRSSSGRQGMPGRSSTARLPFSAETYRTVVDERRAAGAASVGPTKDQGKYG